MQQLTLMGIARLFRNMFLMTPLCSRMPESPAYGDIERVDCSTAEQMLTISWHCSNQETELQNSSNNIHMEMNDIELPMQNKAELKLIDI